MRTESRILTGSWLRHLRPRLIDAFVLREVIGPFLGGVAFFSFVFLMFQVLRLADFFIIHGVGGVILLKMVGLLMLSFLPMAIPVALLIGVLVGFGRLSADGELVALKANGISIFRLTLPALGFSFVIMALTLALNLEWVPWGDRLFKTTLIRVSNTKVVGSIREGTFTSGFFDLLIFADKVDVETNRLHRVFVYDEREKKNPLTVVAREGEVVSVKQSSELAAAAMLKLYDGNIHRNDIAAGTYQKIDFGEYRLFLKVPEGADTATVKPRMIPHRELRNIVRLHPENRELATEFWRRYAVALAPSIFVFLGIGLGTFRTRAVRAGAALISLAVIVVYWSVQAVSAVAAQKGLLHPAVAAQMPNLLTAGLAAWSYRTALW